jgi:HlyD family secretion protein
VDVADGARDALPLADETARRGDLAPGRGEYPRLRRWLVRTSVIVGLLVAVVAMRTLVFAPDPVLVRVARVARGRVEQTVTNTRAGTVKARRRARLSPETGGRVAALPHVEGDRVRKGGILLQIDDALPRARLAVAVREQDAALAQREQSCLAAERAERELERTHRLSEGGIVSADLLDQQQSAARTAAAACEAAEAGAQRARSAVDLARTEIDKTALRAPFDCVVAEVTTQVGEWTTPSPPGLPIPPVIDVIDPSSIYVSAPMDEVDSARIHAGLAARVTVDSHPGKSLPGRVVRVAPYVLDVQAQNRTVEIEVELDDQAFARTLLPGTTADTEVVLDAHADVLRIPTGALMEGSRSLAVEGGRLVERPVEIGIKNWDFAEVRTGLGAGDEVVVSLDRPEVKPGARVRVEQSGAP